MSAAHIRVAAGMAALLALGGCDGTTGLVLTGASLVSFAATDKSLTDHVMSWASGEDCSSTAAIRDGDYCQPQAAENGTSVAVAETPVFCYRTLGDINCYAAPDPQASASRRVQ